jgi:hypothetical protein
MNNQRQEEIACSRNEKETEGKSDQEISLSGKKGNYICTISESKPVRGPILTIYEFLPSPIQNEEQCDYCYQILLNCLTVFVRCCDHFPLTK